MSIMQQDSNNKENVAHSRAMGIVEDPFLSMLRKMQVSLVISGHPMCLELWVSCFCICHWSPITPFYLYIKQHGLSERHVVLKNTDPWFHADVICFWKPHSEHSIFLHEVSGKKITMHSVSLPLNTNLLLSDPIRSR